MDLEEIKKAAENDNNSHILNLTTLSIHKMKNHILDELQLTKVEKMEIMKKIKKYRYVDQMNELKYGGFIRWINITNPENLFLTNGAIFCDFKINDNGVMILYKNFYGKTYEFKMEECIIFQKLSYQEEVLLKVMDKLNS
jgi:hypothetical protein